MRPRRVKVNHRWAVDYHADSCATFKKNICGGIEGSVLNLDVRNLDIHRDLSPLGSIDIFAYGFPCNDFSLVGEHKGIAGDFGACIPMDSQFSKPLDQRPLLLKM